MAETFYPAPPRPGQKDLIIELCQWRRFQRFVQNAGGLQAVLRAPLHRHHIWGGKSRLDLPSNLVWLNSYVHDFAHVWPVQGRLAALWLRTQSGEADFSWAELSVAAGQDARYWVEAHPFTIQPFADFWAYLMEVPLD